MRFQTQRGLLGLGILLKQFMAAKFSRLSGTKLAVFTKLLTSPDSELFAQVNGQNLAADAKSESLLGKIRNSR
ncbi:hypothetical protein A7Q01_08185 [Eikenella sp. NML96-A-049]|uniref:succinate dehydrogenase assembly factor 2 n=1 Tax=unclassified Eikenella TaxID=2639367 RepID=UPI0007DEDE47|nr:MULTISPECIES: succinate dehydrogenase assembly factor 2 [unclassified Eikenella]OAM34635.1 hypothetical protein A7P97_05530 [Eikenella sp. NML070372]OAM39374.1 hypothetical protein A7Q01_08185 [Eikenella sp. NML96-A-049]